MSSGSWMSSEQHRELFESVKNWGRWGPEDEAGALNLITPELRAAAAAEVVHGQAVSCARELPVEPNAENRHPALHMMVRGGDDCVPRASIWNRLVISLVSRSMEWQPRT